MPKLNFVKISTGGNPTILLEAAQVAVEMRAAAAAALMHPLHLGAEQAGFMDCRSSLPSLEMMGGEFCLNATRALAYELWRRGRLLPLEHTEDLYRLVGASGLERPVQIRVRGGRRGGISAEGSPEEADAPKECYLSLGLPWEREQVQATEDGLVLMRLPGIAHLLVEEKKHPPGRDLFQAALSLMARFGLLAEPACGVIWHRPWDMPETGAEGICRDMTPLVRVAATGSLTAESACGSGALALALVLAPAEKSCLLLVRQPSGEFLRLYLNPLRPGDKTRQAEVGGEARLIAEGRCRL
ncbi:MAG: hypothetical protein FWF99_04985 [Desulfovibrionaceae bacterium]|nr:hypothetical protein [Desulfovibrionaceae bacterium]